MRFTQNIIFSVSAFYSMQSADDECSGEWKKKCTHPLSDALTMYCLSLHALALDRQVMEAV